MQRLLRQQDHIPSGIVVALLTLGNLAAYASHNIEVIVNGVHLSIETIEALEHTYGVRLRCGR